MNWIIWTIGWFIAAFVLEEFRLYKDDTKIVVDTNTRDCWWSFLKFIIWIIGMIKFW